MVQMEREEAERERKKEEEERRKRKEEAKKKTRILEAAFDGDNDEITAVLEEVRYSDFTDEEKFQMVFFFFSSIVMLLNLYNY